jgi:hypothetical protein
MQFELYKAILAVCCQKCLGDRWVNGKGKPAKEGEKVVLCSSCLGTGLRPPPNGHRRDKGFDAVDLMESREGRKSDGIDAEDAE